ncbi:MAG: porin, partial [Thermodesulfobacteriota bacterium]|nr:porin [Thermodesulfobacteriota bacterium]
SEFLVRRARICASGTIYKYYSFKVEPEFGMGGGALNDGYLNIKYIPEIQCKIGQFKVPFSVDELTSDNYIDFIERPLPADNLVPSRDYGIMFHGDLASGIVHYGIGIFNGTRKNKGDCNDEKDIAARLVLSPFQKCENLCLQGLHLGGAMTSGNEDMSIQSDQDYWWSKGKFQTAGDTKFFEFDSAVSHRGRRNRYGAELVWIRGPFSLKGEWMRIDLNDLENGSQRGNFHIKGGYVSCSYFITGEQQPFTKGVYKGITPKHKLSPKEGNWGAIQLIARYEMLDLDNHFLTDGYANAAQYTDQVDGFTLGVNWWLNANVRVMVNYNHVDFDNYVAAAGGTSEDIGLFRFQLIY